MDRITYVKIAGKNYPMSFSLGATKKIASQYGNVELMKKTMQKKGNDEKKIDAVIDMLELLIAQGCAYKNYFEADIPAPENAPIIDGKWTPLPREALEIAINIADVEEIVNKIEECIGTGSKKEVEAEPEGKNTGATQV